MHRTGFLVAATGVAPSAALLAPAPALAGGRPFSTDLAV